MSAVASRHLTGAEFVLLRALSIARGGGAHSLAWILATFGEDTEIMGALASLEAAGRVRRIEGGDGRALMHDVWVAS